MKQLLLTNDANASVRFKHIGLLAAIVCLLAGMFLLWRSSTVSIKLEEMDDSIDEQPSDALAKSRHGETLPAKSVGQQGQQDRVPQVNAEPVPTVGGILVKLVWSDDKRAAADRQVFVSPYPSDGSQQWLATDSLGRALFTELRPDRYLVAPFLKGQRRFVNVSKGVTRRIVLYVEKGMEVRGRVVDPTGRGVGGATVWCSEAGNPGRGMPMAETASDGTFTINGVPGAGYVHAVAEGFAPSQRYPVQRLSPNTPLVLGAEPAKLNGIVKDRLGGGIVGAVVVIGYRIPAGNQTLTDGERILFPPATAIRTGEGGRFESEPLAHGSMPVRVTATGFVPHEEHLEIAPGSCESRVFILAQGGVLRGRVLTGSGAAVSEVSILARSNGQVLGMARSLIDGSFTMENLPGGKIRITAEHATSGSASSTTHSIPGSTVSTKLVLVPWRELAGRVDTVSRGELYVLAHCPGQAWYTRAPCDATGRFSIRRGRLETDLLIAITSKEELVGMLSNVAAPDRNLLITSNSRSSGGMLRARSVRPVGRNTILRVEFPSLGKSWQRFPVQEGSTVVAAGPLIGSGSVVVSLEGHKREVIGHYEVQPHQDLDLGTLSLGEGVAIRVRIDTNTVAKRGWYVRLLSGDRSVLELVALSDDGWAEVIAPREGKYCVQGVRSGFVACQRTMMIADVTVETVLRPRPPVARMIVLPREEEYRYPVELQVFDKSGWPFGRYEITKGRIGVASVPAGSYVVVARCASGKEIRAEAVFSAETSGIDLHLSK